MRRYGLVIAVLWLVFASGFAPGQAALDSAGSGEALIKEGEIWLIVADTQKAQEQVIRLLERYQGEVISQTAWTQAKWGVNYGYATLTVAMPAENFEAMWAGLRSIATAVEKETMSSQDAGKELSELWATYRYLTVQRDRLAVLLTRAEDATSRLRANEELTAVEIELRQTYTVISLLEKRVAEGVITVQVNPFIPTPTPRPTLIPTTTPTPTPWSAKRTYGEALAARGVIARWLGQYGSICLFPLLLCGGPLLLALYVFKKRKQRQN